MANPGTEARRAIALAMASAILSVGGSAWLASARARPDLAHFAFWIVAVALGIRAIVIAARSRANAGVWALIALFGLATGFGLLWAFTLEIAHSQGWYPVGAR